MQAMKRVPSRQIWCHRIIGASMVRLAWLTPILAALMVACGGTAAPATVSSAAKPSTAPTSSYQPSALNPAVKLNVAGAGLVGEAGIYAAADKGYFRDEGLDVELLIMQQAADIIPQLIGSQLQFGAVAADAALFNAASRDNPGRIV